MIGFNEPTHICETTRSCSPLKAVKPIRGKPQARSGCLKTATVGYTECGNLVLIDEVRGRRAFRISEHYLVIFVVVLDLRRAFREEEIWIPLINVARNIGTSVV
jgi:hypothetical protein